MPLSIVVTGTGGLLGQGILKALRMSKYKQHNIIGCDTSPESVGLHLCDRGYIVPKAQAQTYIQVIAHICAKEAASALFVGSVPELLTLAENKEYLRKETGVCLIAVDIEIVNLCLDKYKTVVLLKNNGLPHPESVVGEDEAAIEELISKVGFPLVIKPRHSSGSRNLHFVHDSQELHFYRKRVEYPIIQEYVGSDSDEYTCGVFSTGEQVFVISLKRELKDGITKKAIVCPDKRIDALCGAIARLLKLRGSVNVQLRYGRKGFTVLEINPRYSSTTPIRAHYGFNDVEWAIDAFVLGEKIDYRPCNSGVAIRFWEEFYASDDNRNDHEIIDLSKLEPN